MPDSSRLERIGEVIASMDEDSDGIVRVEHVNKVIEILGRDNVQLSGKQVKQIIDLIGKEEMLEVENKIEKIQGKMPVFEEKAQAVKEKVAEGVEKDLTEGPAEHLLEDAAADLSEERMEEHIAEIFSRPSEAKKEEVRVEVVALAEGEVLSRPRRDNSVKEVSRDLAAEKEEEELEKIPQKNGSSKH